MSVGPGSIGFETALGRARIALTSAEKAEDGTRDQQRYFIAAAAYSLFALALRAYNKDYV